MMNQATVDHEIKILATEMVKFAEKQADGTYKTTFGKIFKDEVLEQTLESLVGTMKAARRAGVIQFKGEMLLQGAHDNVEVVLLKPDFGH